MPPSEFDELSLRETREGVEIAVRVVPCAGRSALAGMRGAALKVQVAAPAIEGRGNRELCAFLARLAGVARRDVCILHGERGRDKRVLLRGLTAERLAHVLPK